MYPRISTYQGSDTEQYADDLLTHLPRACDVAVRYAGLQVDETDPYLGSEPSPIFFAQSPLRNFSIRAMRVSALFGESVGNSEVQRGSPYQRDVSADDANVDKAV